MSKVVDGFMNQVWLIMKYGGASEEEVGRFPLDKMIDQEVKINIEILAKKHLTPSEIENSPRLWRARQDNGDASRVIFSAGENPHYVASLWRADELGEN